MKGHQPKYGEKPTTQPPKSTRPDSLIPFDIDPDMTVSVESMSVTYIQDGDHESQSITIKTGDHGAGLFYTITTDGWSFDSVTELVNLIQDFLKRAGADA
jgi:hypothetical protein